MITVEYLVKAILRPGPQWWRLFSVLGFSLCVGSAIALPPPTDQPIITALSVAGENIVFHAFVPAGMDKVVLEMRSTFDAPWRDVAQRKISNGDVHVEFTIPKPANDMAIFRLRTMSPTASAIQVSTELQYVAALPLGSPGANGATNDAIFHFKGIVDGSDRIVITRAGAFWEHINWGWPAGSVTVNGVQWNAREKNYLTTTGVVSFLPDAYSLDAASLKIVEARDVVALERTNGALIVYLNDTPSGAAPYEFKINFHPASAGRTAANSPSARLRIAAVIDGSDFLKITPQGATWEHRAYAFPGGVKLNDIAWNVREKSMLMNTGTNSFLAPGVDLSTARIVSRKGRDLGTLWADADGLWIRFADNPNGADFYELEIAFGR